MKAIFYVFGQVILLNILINFTSAQSTENLEPTAEQMLEQANRAELDNNPTHALALYKRSLELGLQGRRARNVQRQINWITERSENNYDPLTKLWIFQHRPLTQTSVEQIREFERQVALFPQGKTVHDALFAIARSWATKGQHQEAERVLSTWLARRDVPPDLHREGTVLLAQVRIQLGHGQLADRTLENAGISSTSLNDTAKAVARSRIFDPVCWGVISSQILLLILSLFQHTKKTLKNAFSLTNIFLVVFVAAPPYFIAITYEPAATYFFTRLCLGLAFSILATQIISTSNLMHKSFMKRLYLVLAFLVPLAIGYLTLTPQPFTVSFTT